MEGCYISKCDGIDCRDCPIYMDNEACPYWKNLYVEQNAFYYMRENFTAKQIANIESW